MPIINLDDSEAISENLIGRTEVKAGLGDVVGARVVPFKLTSGVMAVGILFAAEKTMFL